MSNERVYKRHNNNQYNGCPKRKRTVKTTKVKTSRKRDEEIPLLNKSPASPTISTLSLIWNNLGAGSVDNFSVSSRLRGITLIFLPKMVSLVILLVQYKENSRCLMKIGPVSRWWFFGPSVFLPLNSTRLGCEERQLAQYYFLLCSALSMDLQSMCVWSRVPVMSSCFGL